MQITVIMKLTVPRHSVPRVYFRYKPTARNWELTGSVQWCKQVALKPAVQKHFRDIRVAQEFVRQLRAVGWDVTPCPLSMREGKIYVSNHPLAKWLHREWAPDHLTVVRDTRFGLAKLDEATWQDFIHFALNSTAKAAEAEAVEAEEAAVAMAVADEDEDSLQGEGEGEGEARPTFLKHFKIKCLEDLELFLTKAPGFKMYMSALEKLVGVKRLLLLKCEKQLYPYEGEDWGGAHILEQVTAVRASTAWLGMHAGLYKELCYKDTAAATALAKSVREHLDTADKGMKELKKCGEAYMSEEEHPRGILQVADLATTTATATGSGSGSGSGAGAD